jgi:hypothetical protein
VLIGSFIQQPAERLDYDIDFSRWMPSADRLESALVEVAPNPETGGLTIEDPLVDEQRIKLWVSDGTDGVKYKLTVTATTHDGRTVQVELSLKIKDY